MFLESRALLGKDLLIFVFSSIDSVESWDNISGVYWGSACIQLIAT